MQFLSLVLFVLLVILQVADAYLTWRVLAAGGREVNPIVRLLMEQLGVVFALALSKLVLLVVTGLWLADHLILLLMLVTLYAWVVVHNGEQLARTSSNQQGN